MKRTVIIGIVAIVVIGALAVLFLRSEGERTPSNAPTATTAQPSPPPDPSTAPSPSTPSFVVVRVVQGHAVIAGRAAPILIVRLLDGG